MSYLVQSLEKNNKKLIYVKRGLLKISSRSLKIN